MRGKRAKKREVKPDVIYKSVLVSKFINNVMRSGKKLLAERLVYESLASLEKELKGSSLEILEKAIENASPNLEVRSRRVGGVNYQVPVPVRESRQQALAVRWIINGARTRRKKGTFQVALADELKDAYNNTGFAVKKKDEVYRMAAANKAFAHFQW